ncbi:NAD(P)-dependent oxidoreductase [Pusillimonas sp. NJUB218]|uniref:NAD-dependent epimerase/dehydratase family protein n=1 Tax=Pusillimonas sp. NJUB218 TaxID=2023230 RepID=UPI001315471F|nr:NAD(P)-dependent oxidoreductase [Pusillimonas sp. NJUB218]
MISGKRILVTGANGLLGRRVVALLSQTNDVFAVVHEMPTEPIAGVRYFPIDLAKPWGVELLPARVDAIIHLAQSAHFRDVPSRALEVFQVNIASTAQLLDYAWRTGTERFVYASSGGIYSGGVQTFYETSPVTQPDTLGYYLGSKVSCEALASSYARFLKVMVLRFFFIYGRGQNRTMLIPRLIDNIRGGRSITIQGEMGLRLNPIHVSDAAATVLAALSSENSGIYNVAGPEILSLRELCNEIGALVGKSAIYDVMPGTPSDVVGDISMMSAHLHVPSVAPRTGLRELI